jgi:hypothetical protein
VHASGVEKRSSHGRWNNRVCRFRAAAKSFAVARELHHLDFRDLFHGQNLHATALPGTTRTSFSFLGTNRTAQLYFQRACHPTACAWQFMSIRIAMAWGCRQDSTKALTQRSLREPSRLGHEVILFRDTRRPSGRNSVVFDGAFMIANHFGQRAAARHPCERTRSVHRAHPLRPPLLLFASLQIFRR